METLQVVHYRKDIVPSMHRTANPLRFGVRIRQLVFIVFVSAIYKRDNPKDTRMCYTSKFLKENNLFVATLGPNVKERRWDHTICRKLPGFQVVRDHCSYCCFL